MLNGQSKGTPLKLAEVRHLTQINCRRPAQAAASTVVRTPMRSDTSRVRCRPAGSPWEAGGHPGHGNGGRYGIDAFPVVIGNQHCWAVPHRASSLRWVLARSGRDVSRAAL